MTTIEHLAGTMATHRFALIIVLVFISAASSTQPPCPEGGCRNFTVYLGPRWGSRVIIFPEHADGIGNEEPAIEIHFWDKGDQQDSSAETIRLYPQRRPVPEDNRFGVGYNDEERLRPLPTTARTVPTNNPRDRTTRRHGAETTVHYWWMTETRRPSTHRPITRSTTTSPSPITHRAFSSGIFNLSGQGLSGEDVRWSLSNLSSDVTAHLRRLHLSGNNIRRLEPLTFPVELEYNLLELRLDDNPLSVLNSYTRFELSRLGLLTSLGLARTGLRYLEPLYIPSLKELDLRGNHLTSLQSLDSLPNLEKLFLDGNRITTLYDFQLISLRFLSLTGNGLSYITDDAAKSLSQVQIVHLNNNSLDSVEEIHKHFYTNDLYLSDNPWVCSCQLVDLAQMDQPRILDKDNLKCLDDYQIQPRAVKGLSPGDVHQACPSKWSWLMTRGRDEVDHSVWWVRTRVLRLPTLLLGLGWLLFVVAVVLKVRSYRRAKAKVTDVPYNVLDDTQVA